MDSGRCDVVVPNHILYRYPSSLNITTSFSELYVLADVAPLDKLQWYPLSVTYVKMYTAYKKLKAEIIQSSHDLPFLRIFDPIPPYKNVSLKLIDENLAAFAPSSADFKARSKAENFIEGFKIPKQQMKNQFDLVPQVNYSCFQFSSGIKDKCVITSCENGPWVFYVRLKLQELQLEILNKQLQCAPISYDQRPLNITKGLAVLYKHPEIQIPYRGLILSEQSNKSISMYYVDFGLTESVNINNIWLLPKDLSITPMLVTKCHLEGLPSMSDTYISKKFERITKDKLIDVTITGFNSDGITDVKLFVDGKDVISLLCKPFESQVLFENDEIALSSYETTDFDSIFYFQKVEYFNKVEQMQEQLQRYAELTPLTTKCEERQPCIALFDGQWYRAIVLEKDEKIKVRYVDYGNVGIIDIKDLRPIDYYFLDYAPTFATSCVIRNLDYSQSANVKALLDCGDEKFIIKNIENYESSDINETLKVDIIYKNSGISVLDEAQKMINVEPQFETLSVSVSGVSLSENSIKLCFVSYVKDPLHFYVRILENESQFREMTDSLNSLSSNNAYLEPNEYERIGSFVAVKLKDDWARGIIKRCMGDVCEIFLIDYGYNMKFNFYQEKDVKVIDERFLNIAPFAVKCKLTNCKAEFSSLESKNFKQKVQNKNFEVKFLSNDNEFWEVNLVSAVVNINESLLWKSEDCNQSFEENPQNSKENSIEKESLNKPVGKKKVKFSMEKAQNKYDCELKSRKASTKLINSKQLQLDYVPLSTNTNIQIEVLWVKSPHEFYFKPVSESSKKFNRIMEEANDYYANLKPVNDCSFSIGDYVMACSSSDEVWYRAIVKAVSDKTIIVFYFDYGNCEDVECKYARPLEMKFLENLPIQALCCILPDIKLDDSDWAQGDIKKVENYLYNYSKAQASLQISPNSNEYIAIEINFDGVDYIDFLETSQIIKKIDAEPRMLLDQDCVTLCHADLKEKTFWVQRKNDQDILYHIEERFKRNLSHMEKFTDSMVAVNSACFVLSIKHNEWFRAQVISNHLEENKQTVLFIDYGDSECVPAENVLKVSAMFLKNSPFAYCCSFNQDLPEDVFQSIMDKYLNQVSNMLSYLNSIYLFDSLYIY